MSSAHVPATGVTATNLPATKPQFPVISRGPIRKTSQLKALLLSEQTEFILEAHNGLSAKIVEEAGFDGIWGSGLSISAQLGVRDNNEASWTQVLEVVEFMSDSTTIPILLDGDTGYGNFNNMRRLVQKLEQRGVGGVCIEDKLFPKTNSFIAGETQPIADVDEFCGKIKAGKDAQADDDFCIIARVEAFIAGHGLAAALRRAEAYHAAGADAILMHSKISRPDEILAFCGEWANRSPVVIVPTKYYSTPTDVFRQANVSLIIWANHVLRASLSAMQRVAATIKDEQSLVNVEDRVAPLGDVFRLQGAEELQEAEKKYLTTRSKANCVILAASQGAALGELTADIPKCMVPVAGTPVLQRLVEDFRRAGVGDVHVVAGYKADQVAAPGIQRIENSAFAVTGELASLDCALSRLTGPTVVSYGDVLFRRYVINDLVDAREEMVVVVDSTAGESSPDRLRCSSADCQSVFAESILLEKFTDVEPHGAWTGLAKVGAQGAEWIRAAMERLRTREDFDQLEMHNLFAEIIEAGHPIHVLYVRGHWININRLADLGDATTFTADI